MTITLKYWDKSQYNSHEEAERCGALYSPADPLYGCSAAADTLIHLVALAEMLRHGSSREVMVTITINGNPLPELSLAEINLNLLQNND